MSIASIPSSWEPILTEEFEQPYFEKLQDFLTKSRQTETIFPAEADVFSAFELTAYENVNVVLTVQAHIPNSHKNKGWETFTDASIGVFISTK
jgi:uracil-DNA glycosylase